MSPSPKFIWTVRNDEERWLSIWTNCLKPTLKLCRQCQGWGFGKSSLSLGWVFLWWSCSWAIQTPINSSSSTFLSVISKFTGSPGWTLLKLLWSVIGSLSRKSKHLFTLPEESHKLKRELLRSNFWDVLFIDAYPTPTPADQISIWITIIPHGALWEERFLRPPSLQSSLLQCSLVWPRTLTASYPYTRHAAKLIFGELYLFCTSKTLRMLWVLISSLGSPGRDLGIFYPC